MKCCSEKKKKDMLDMLYTENKEENFHRLLIRNYGNQKTVAYLYRTKNKNCHLKCCKWRISFQTKVGSLQTQGEDWLERKSYTTKVTSGTSMVVQGLRI